MKLLRISTTPFLIVLLILALFVVACGSTNSGTTSVSTPKPPTPTPTPTVNTFKDDDFAITYPNGWSEKNNNFTVELTKKPDAGMTITVTSTISEVHDLDAYYNLYLTGYINMLKSTIKNFQQTTAPATVQVGGETWHQISFTGSMQNDGTVENFTAITVKHKNQEFTILYGDDQKTYDGQIFQTMLQSFKFTA